ncbi:MAG: LysE family transporter [Verrucomicrobia bacterium]|nr:LysE family transporter [Verrucomicrobiota bacterium]
MVEILLILLVTQFLAIMSPGPDMFLILKNTLGQSGNGTAIFTILGIGLGLTVHISISIGGLAILLVQSENLYRLLRYAGAAYLAYIGLKSLIRQSSFTQNSYNGGSGKSWRTAFVEGLFTNLLNPKVTLYIFSLFTQLIAPNLPLWQKVTYGLVLIAEAIMVWILFSLAVNLPNIRTRIESFSVRIDRLFGLILICIAGTVFLNS